MPRRPLRFSSASVAAPRCPPAAANQCLLPAAHCCLPAAANQCLLPAAHCCLPIFRNFPGQSVPVSFAPPASNRQAGGSHRSHLPADCCCPHSP
ncbi:MAG TPA: hypothetical protein DCF42_01240 [Lachnospiraceae bacterium]|nr:hypothetical protein [Lachnospiraceae bacterium]